MKNNHVELKGTLTRNIEVSKSQKGNSFTKFTLKCLRDDQGTRFDYVGCIAFGEIAEKLEKVGTKKVGTSNTKFKIIGNLQTSSYKKDDQKIYSMNVVVESFELLNE